ncbi:hypothetical protein SUGI_0009650 [Cryptomeria japonica]|nr:hypothetical protein SUGI_0009650 [Cryptomeria japonica]
MSWLQNILGNISCSVPAFGLSRSTLLTNRSSFFKKSAFTKARLKTRNMTNVEIDDYRFLYRSSIFNANSEITALYAVQ